MLHVHCMWVIMPVPHRDRGSLGLLVVDRMRYYPVMTNCYWNMVDIYQPIATDKLIMPPKWMHYECPLHLTPWVGYTRRASCHFTTINVAWIHAWWIVVAYDSLQQLQKVRCSGLYFCQIFTLLFYTQNNIEWSASMNGRSPSVSQTWDLKAEVQLGLIND